MKVKGASSFNVVSDIAIYLRLFTSSAQAYIKGQYVILLLFDYQKTLKFKAILWTISDTVFNT